MARKIPFIYWDSNVFIDGLQRTAGRFEHISRIEDDARAEKLKIVTSAFTIAEVVKTGMDLLPEEDERKVRAYFAYPFVSVSPVDRVVGKIAAEVVRTHGLKPPDAIHVATALRSRAEALCTYDSKRLLPLDRQIKGLRIFRPDDYGQLTLFSAAC